MATVQFPVHSSSTAVERLLCRLNLPDGAIQIMFFVYNSRSTQEFPGFTHRYVALSVSPLSSTGCALLQRSSSSQCVCSCGWACGAAGCSSLLWSASCLCRLCVTPCVVAWFRWFLVRVPIGWRGLREMIGILDPRLFFFVPPVGAIWLFPPI